MEQLVREIRAYLKKKYTAETIKQVGLEDYDDIARLMIDNRERRNFVPEHIVDEYIQEQLIMSLLEKEEEDVLFL